VKVQGVAIVGDIVLMQLDNSQIVKLSGIKIVSGTADKVKADLLTLKGRTVLVTPEAKQEDSITPSATVFVPSSGGTTQDVFCINLNLLKKGLVAFDEKGESSRSQVLKKAETEAKNAGVGIWKNTNSNE
jgi:hypothetical protein